MVRSKRMLSAKKAALLYAELQACGGSNWVDPSDFTFSASSTHNPVIEPVVQDKKEEEEEKDPFLPSPPPSLVDGDMDGLDVCYLSAQEEEDQEREDCSLSPKKGSTSPVDHPTLQLQQEKQEKEKGKSPLLPLSLVDDADNSKAKLVIIGQRASDKLSSIGDAKKKLPSYLPIQRKGLVSPNPFSLLMLLDDVADNNDDEASSVVDANNDVATVVGEMGSDTNQPKKKRTKKRKNKKGSVKNKS